MTALAVDALLASWDERLRRVDENLLALEAEPTYQVLAGTAGERARLEGVTLTRVGPSLDALGELFENRARLVDALDRAKAIRREFSAIWKNDDKVAQIRALLEGASIPLGARPTPLAHLRLLDGPASDRAIAPEQLLAWMAQTFEQARDAVLAVAEAWAFLEPAIARAEADAVAIHRAAETLGDASFDSPEIAGLERELASIRMQIARDPLGARALLHNPIAPGLAAARARVEAQAAARARVLEALPRADALRAAIDQALADAARARETIARDFEGVTVHEDVPASLVEGLDVWRAKIEGTARAGRWSSAEVGLTRWLETAAGYVAIERNVASMPGELAAKRAELQGRLGARRAQLTAIARRGIAIPARATTAADAVATLLQTTPTSLERAEQALLAFEREVIAAHAQNE